MSFKKFIYILAFITLGILISFLIHAVIEISVIALLLKNFSRYGLGLSWGEWVVIDHVGSVALLFLGIIIGFKQGRKWWQIIYVERRYKIK